MKREAKLPPLPDRPVDGHKGLFGRVLIVAGSDAMPGAAALSGTTALRSGAGLVQVATTPLALGVVLSVTPELIGLPLAGRASMRELRDAADKADAIVIGPGLGRQGDVGRVMKELLSHDKPAVLDADALNYLAAQKSFPSMKLDAVLTPHPGEMRRLAKTFLSRDDIPTDDAGRRELALLAAKTFGQTILLKGTRTVIATPDGRIALNRTGDSSLSKAGAGDVLSGLIGTLLAQRMSPFDAARLAAHIHGRAGEVAGHELGQRCVLARDVIDALPAAIASLESPGRGSTVGR
jgi:hydroxyethylthiazole kinase-like uncharacterized protein yjeF